MEDPKKEFLSTTVTLAVLAALADEPKYGYQLIKELHDSTDGFFDLREGALYPVLHGLEKRGLLKAEWRRVKPGTSRRYYTITLRGKAALFSHKEQWAGIVKAVSAVLGGGLGLALPG